MGPIAGLKKVKEKLEKETTLNKEKEQKHPSGPTLNYACSLFHLSGVAPKSKNLKTSSLKIGCTILEC